MLIIGENRELKSTFGNCKRYGRNVTRFSRDEEVKGEETLLDRSTNHVETGNSKLFLEVLKDAKIAVRMHTDHAFPQHMLTSC